jgi:DNA repair protein SbcD/Mre11
VRLIHTSDWHLGRSFGPVSLADQQEGFADWLVAQCRGLRADLVVVAGDVFDRAVPPVDALALFRETLGRLLDTGVVVAVITGNHDGPDRVALYGPLLDGRGLYVRGGYGALGEVLRLRFADGPLDVVLLPFLDPQAAPDDLPEPPATDGAQPDGDDLVARRQRRTHQSVLAAAIAAARPALTAPRSLAVAHAFVAGAAVSDSERLLTVGGTGTVGADLFAGFSYTALGHLHRPQPVGDRPTVRYSGTPLAYSFSEVDPKSITVVDLDADGSATVETVEVPVGRPVRTIVGTMEQLLAIGADTRSFVRAIVTDPGVVLDAKQRLAAVFPHVVEVVPQPLGRDITDAPVRAAAAHADPAATVGAFWEAVTGAPPSPAERALLLDAVEAGRRKVEA